MRKIIVFGTLAILLGMLASVPLFAQSGEDYAWRQNKFNIDLGWFLTSVSTTAQLDSTVYGYGTSVDLEKNLGLDDQPSTFRLDGSWRFFNRHQLVFSYYQINRSSSHTLDRPISWGDYTFQYGTGTNARWDSNFYQLYYQYSIVQGPKGEFGAGIGVSWLNQKAELKGSAVIGRGNSTQIYYVEQSSTLDAPVPVIGVFGLYEFTPKFIMKGDIYYLKVNLSDVDGSYTDAKLTFDYYPWKNMGFGLGWYYNKYSVDSTKSGWDGSFDYNFNGPAAYLSFRF
jgi:hypothetical protein